MMSSPYANVKNSFCSCVVTASELDLLSTKHSFKLAEIKVNAAVLTAFDTADI
jgi:hypothetical protein